MEMNNKPRPKKDRLDIFERHTALFAQFIANGAFDAFIAHCEANHPNVDGFDPVISQLDFDLVQLLKDFPTWFRELLYNKQDYLKYHRHSELARETIDAENWNAFCAGKKATSSRGIPVGDVPYDFSLEWGGCGLSFTFTQDTPVCTEVAAALPRTSNGALAAVDSGTITVPMLDIIRPSDVDIRPPGIYFFPNRHLSKRWVVFAPYHIVPWIRKHRPGYRDPGKSPVPQRVHNWHAYHRRRFFKSLRDCSNYRSVDCPIPHVIRSCESDTSGVKEKKNGSFLHQGHDAVAHCGELVSHFDVALLVAKGFDYDIAQDFLAKHGNDVVSALLSMSQFELLSLC